MKVANQIFTKYIRAETMSNFSFIGVLIFRVQK